MLLGVNTDHVATLRNARGGDEPSLIEAVKICVHAGADGITTHLREDRRHIRDNDVYTIKKEIACRLNLEMAATEEMQEIALDVKPDACCIVPEKRMEVTTEGGLDVAGRPEYMKSFVAPLLDAGIEVSLFIDADEKTVKASYETGVKFIELHTGAYANAYGTEREEIEFQKLKNAAEYAHNLGLTVNAGHGLNYQNVHRMHEIKNLHELNIGHTIISRAIFVGLYDAVKEMKNLVTKFNI